VELHVEVVGEGPTLLLAHGFGGSARNFRSQTRALRGSHRVVTFDTRGHARSAAPRAATFYAFECLVEDIGRVLDDVDAPSAVVGGLSLGAAAALGFAMAQPERVEQLVLASYPTAASGAGRAAERFAEAIERDGLEAAGARFVWGPDSGLDVAGAALVRQGFLEHSPHGLAHTLREAIAHLPEIADLAPRLAGLRVPTLILAGSEDGPAVANGRALEHALPDARLVVVEAAGHVLNLERPREFDAALLDFLRP